MSLCLNSSDGINEMGLPLRTKDEICDKVTQTQSNGATNQLDRHLFAYKMHMPSAN